MVKAQTTPSERSEDLLREAAIRLFGRHDYDSVSVKQIAELAGVNVALISYHFGGKLGLYRECIGKFGKDRLSTVERILTPPSSHQEMVVRLKMFIAEMIETQMERPDISAIIHRECEMMNPAIEDIFTATFLQVFKTLAAFLKTSKQKKYIRSEVDPLFTASMIFGIISNMTRMSNANKRYLSIDMGNAKDRQRFAEEAANVVLQGISLKGVSV